MNAQRFVFSAILLGLFSAMTWSRTSLGNPSAARPAQAQTSEDATRVFLPQVLRAADKDRQHFPAVPAPIWRHFGRSNRLEDLAYDPQRDLIYAASPAGLLRWRPGFLRPDVLSHRSLNQVEVGPDGEVWTGGRDDLPFEGLERFDPEGGRSRVGPQDGLDFGRLTALAVDDLGTVWASFEPMVHLDGVIRPGGFAALPRSGPSLLLPFESNEQTRKVKIEPDDRGGALLMQQFEWNGPLHLSHVDADGTVREALPGSPLNEGLKNVIVGELGQLFLLRKPDSGPDRLYVGTLDGEFEEIHIPWPQLEAAYPFELPDPHHAHPLHNMASLLAQATGELWLSTLGGMLLRDASGTWKLWPDEDLPELPRDQARRSIAALGVRPPLTLLSQGSLMLWALPNTAPGQQERMAGGVSRLTSDGRLLSLHDPAGLPISHFPWISDLEIDHRDRPIFLAREQVWRLDEDERWRRLNQLDGELTRWEWPSATDIAVGSEGAVWFAAGQHFARMDDQDRVTGWSVPEAPEDATIGRLKADGSSRLWLMWNAASHARNRRTDQGVTVADWVDGAWRFERPAATRPFRVRDVAPKPNGGAWLAVEAEPRRRQQRGEYGAGILELDPSGNGTLHAEAEGLPSLNTRSLILDDDQRLWAATDRGVAVREPDGRWRLEGVAEGLTSPSVLSLSRSPEGEIWAATAGGGATIRSNDGIWRPADETGEWEMAFTTALRFDSLGHAWYLGRTQLPHRGWESRLARQLRR